MAVSGQNRSHDEQFDRWYKELKALAGYHLGRERSNHTLQPTALANEAYLRLHDQPNSMKQGKTLFLSIASEMIRRILVDHARQRNAKKRSGKLQQLELSQINIPEFSENPIDILDLDASLIELAELNERQARIVELRFFAGLSVEETAKSMKVSVGTIKNDWRIARAWLRVRMHR